MNGKGDQPRNNFSKAFRENYDAINWKSSPRTKKFDPKEDPYKNIAQHLVDAMIDDEVKKVVANRMWQKWLIQGIRSYNKPKK